MRCMALMVGCLGLLLPAAASAQSWLPDRGRPALWEISAVDESGEQGWPYGREDIAGDGLGTFTPTERATDVRSVYANADADRLWLRAYVVSEAPPLDTLVLYVFMDTDANDNTGGSAAIPTLFGDFDDDPTDGGYERIVGVQADGAVLGLWRWDPGSDAWIEDTPPVDRAIEVERGVDVDPLRIYEDRRGYLQFSVDHTDTGLNTTCGVRLFTRTWSDDPDDDYGDLDAGGARPCVPVDTNVDRNPDVIEVVGCINDDDCPGDSVCYEGRVCLIGYTCADDGDCPDDDACSNNRCVRVITSACNDDDDCDGQRCDSGACRACNDDGDCGAGRVCSPRGACLDEQDIIEVIDGSVAEDGVADGGADGGDVADGDGDGAGDSDGGAAEDEITLEADERVQGGACTCQTQRRDGAPLTPLTLLLFAAATLLAFFGRRHVTRRQGDRS